MVYSGCVTGCDQAPSSELVDLSRLQIPPYSPATAVSVFTQLSHDHTQQLGLKLSLSVGFMLSRFSHVRLCVTPEMAAQQAPPSLGFSRQEHQNGLPFPSPVHESEK